MSAGWTLGPGLAARIAVIPGPRLATPAEQLQACVYPLRESDGTWTFRFLPSWPTAIYIALDEHHACLYTGIVQRGTTEQPEANAIRDRTREHYRDNEPPRGPPYLAPPLGDSPRTRHPTWRSRDMGNPSAQTDGITPDPQEHTAAPGIAPAGRPDDRSGWPVQPVHRSQHPARGVGAHAALHPGVASPGQLRSSLGPRHQPGPAASSGRPALSVRDG